MTATLQVGVDIGGTFTDVVARDSDGNLQYFKVPTTRDDPGVAVLESIARICRDWNVEPGTITRFAHGTTVATNAILERKGARLGLITTAGFRDVLEIGRQMRSGLYDIVLKPETPTFLVPRSRRKEVAERVTFDGQVLRELDEAAVIRAANELVEDGVEAIAVSFLYAYLRPEHEIRAAQLIREAFPHLTVSLSHEVNPMYREYERTVVTGFDAYVKPVIDRYLTNLETGLHEAGVTVPLQVMQSRGGLMASPIARQRPVRLFLSGPAAGVVGAQISGTAAGHRDLITVDVGGTSSDIAVIQDGQALIRPEGLVDGFTVRVPMVDVNSIGSGGGSIAWTDVGGALRVGPMSAGSEPGPAGFGKGGKEPTVTDASIVLGYLNPANFAGGALALSPELAADAIRTRLAESLQLDLHEAALGIHRIVNAQMAEGIRAISTRQGLDPRSFALMPLGGGGAVHATALARELGMRTIVVPRFPGVLCAAGLLASAVDHEVTYAYGRDFDGLDVQEVRNALASVNDQCSRLMEKETLGGAPIEARYFADVCFIGQGYWLEVELFLDKDDMLSAAYEAFLVRHEVVYGHSERGRARIINLRAVQRAGGDERIDRAPYRPNGKPPVTGIRKVLIEREAGFVDATIYDRAALPAGFEFFGPAVVEQPDTTVLVDADWKVKVDEFGNLIMKARH